MPQALLFESGGELVVPPPPPPAPGACFTSDTKVAMSNGRFKEISKIRIGDKVFAYNIKTRKWSKVFVTELQGGKNKGFFLLNKKLRVSPYHSVYVNGKAKKPSEIKLLDTLTTADRRKIKVTSIEYIDKKVDMHNLVLGRNENLLYVVNGFLVWNGW